jgi:hypothetical protein
MGQLLGRRAGQRRLVVGSVAGVAADHRRDVDAQRLGDLLEQLADRRRVRRGVRRDRAAVAAVDEVDLAGLDLARGARDLGEDRVEVLQDEHVHRLAAARPPRLRDLGQRRRHRLTVGGDRRGLAGGVELADLALDLGRDLDVGLEAELLELATHLLQLALGFGARLQARGLGALLLDAGLTVELRLDLAQLVALLLDDQLRVGHRDLAARARAGLGLLGGAHRVRLRDRRELQDLGDPATTEALQVLTVVGDVLDLERVEAQPELLEVGVRRLLELLGELEAILVDLLRRHRREHAADVALERLLGDARDLLAGHAEEALDRVRDEPAVGRDLDVRDRGHRQRDAALGVRAGHLHVHRDVRDVHAHDVLDERVADAATAEHDAEADRAAVRRRVLAAREDQDLVGPADVEQVLDDEHQEQQHADGAGHRVEHGLRHGAGRRDDREQRFGHHLSFQFVSGRVTWTRPSAPSPRIITRAPTLSGSASSVTANRSSTRPLAVTRTLPISPLTRPTVTSPDSPRRSLVDTSLDAEFRRSTRSAATIATPEPQPTANAAPATASVGSPPE